MASNTTGAGRPGSNRSRSPKPGPSAADLDEELIAFEAVIDKVDVRRGERLESVQGLKTREDDLRKREEKVKKLEEDVKKREDNVKKNEDDLKQRAGRLGKQERVFLDARRTYLSLNEENERLRDQMKRLEVTLGKLRLGWVLTDARSGR